MNWNYALSYLLLLSFIDQNRATRNFDYTTWHFSGLGNLCRKPESGSERSSAESRVAAFFSKRSREAAPHGILSETDKK